MIPYATQAGQDPHDVARAVVRSAARWASRPETALLARAELAPYRPSGPPDMAGRWIPQALQRWARSLAYYREPSGEGSPGELVVALPVVIATAGGDCDDLAAAVGAMARALGFSACVGLLYPLQGNPSAAHVFTAVSEDWNGAEPRRWFIVDPQQAEPAPPESFPGCRWFPIP